MYSVISEILNFILAKMSKSLCVISKDNTPKDSKYVMTCTHESYNEVIMLGMALYPSQIHYMAKKGLFKNRWIGKFLTSLNAFPVDRENPRPSTLRRPVNLLKDSKAIGIFPTGSCTSQEDASLKHGTSAVTMLSKSPVLPVAYVGPAKVRGLITGQAYVNTGKPIGIDDSPKDLKRNERTSYITKEIETQTAKL